MTCFLSFAAAFSSKHRKLRSLCWQRKRRHDEQQSLPASGSPKAGVIEYVPKMKPLYFTVSAGTCLAKVIA